MKQPELMVYDKEALESHAISIAQRVIGGKWAFVILHLISHGPIRFSQIKNRIPLISQATLTKHLRLLEDAALIHRQVYPEVPPRVEYTLTELGKTFIPVLQALTVWGESYRAFLKENPEVAVQIFEGLNEKVPRI